MGAGGAAAPGPYLTRRRFVPAGTGKASGTLANVLIPAETLYEFAALRFGWSYRDTSDTPLWLFWSILEET